MNKMIAVTTFALLVSINAFATSNLACLLYQSPFTLVKKVIIDMDQKNKQNSLLRLGDRSFFYIVNNPSVKANSVLIEFGNPQGIGSNGNVIYKSSLVKSQEQPAFSTYAFENRGGVTPGMDEKSFNLECYAIGKETHLKEEDILAGYGTEVKDVTQEVLVK
jgi:hypothetical protein